jgi:ribonuclease HII
VDEAGRGPLAGPVVASAVILKSFRFKERIDDSKKLSKDRRERACREIFEKAFVGIGVVDEKLIDEMNIYQATKLAMEKALATLDVPPDFVLIDGTIRLDTSHPQLSIVSGDSKSLSIAAASIVAKVTRDGLMCEYDGLYPVYGFKEHKGYPTKRHKAALSLHGPSPIHRRTYAPVKRCMKSRVT